MSDNIYLKMIEDIEDYAILFLGKSGTIESWNKGAEKIKGYKREEIIGTSFKVFYTENDQKIGLPQQLLAEAAQKGKAVYEGWRVRKDGSMFWGSIVATAVYDDDRQLLGFTKVTRDLTDKKLEEERLLEFNRQLEQKVKEQNAELFKNEKRLRAIVENNYDAISLRDAGGKLIYQSPAAEKLTGYTQDEMNGMAGMDLYHPEDRATVMAREDYALRNPGLPVFGVNRMRNKAGHYLWVEGTITNLLQDEHVQAVVGNFRDITARKQAEDKIIKANRLYAFVSAINQAIVHVRTEQALFTEVCRIAVEIGKFETAWISIPDKSSNLEHVVAGHNLTHADTEFLNSVVYDYRKPKALALEIGKHYVINDIKNTGGASEVRSFALKKGFSSFIALPVTKAGAVIGSFNLNSLHTNMFDEQEIKLLQEVVRDISFALDVFENERYRKLTEEKIRHSELRLNQAQSIAHFGSWELNFATGMGTWSEEACSIYGLHPRNNQHTYEDWLSFIHPEDLHYVKTVTKHGRDAQGPASFFHRIIRKDGAVRHIFSQAEIEFRDGMATGLYGIVHDITETKLAQEALQLSTTNLHLILDLIPQAVFVKDINGRFIFVNKSFAALYGATPEQLFHKTQTDTIPDKNDSGSLIMQDREIIRKGIMKVIPEIDFRDNNGRERTFTSIKVPYIVPGTNEHAVLSIAQDITEQKRIEAERMKMVSDIVQRNKDLEQFSYIVSHNLRAPVANIIGLANLFRIAKPDEEETERMMEELSATADRLDGVIRDLNYILQIRSHVSENRTLVRFAELVADIEISISSQLADADATITSDFEGAETMFSIRSYLHSIFFNLISNSIKYRQSGKPCLISISGRRRKKGIELVFEDNGLGIDLPRKAEYVFGLYKRFHDHVEGKGVGLYMVKAQVETLGGRISVESEVNKGTTFRIVFENNKPEYADDSETDG